jgi:lysophospholipase L1-like esterase
VCVIGATVTPYVGSGYYQPAPHNEEDRQALNQWIRSSGVFDAVVDFDAALRDPAQPERLQKALDVGDGLHPSIAGYRAMADAVPLEALRKCGAAQ